MPRKGKRGSAKHGRAEPDPGPPGGDLKEANPAAGPTYYIFVDDNGNSTVVDALSLVPRKHRASAREVTLAPPKNSQNIADTIVDSISAFAGGGRGSQTQSTPVTGPGGIPIPPWAIGAGVLALVLIGVGIKFKLKLLVKAALAVAVAAAGSSFYLGWVRKQSGLSSSTMSQPKEIIDDAQKAVDTLELSMQNQQQLLDMIAADGDDPDSLKKQQELIERMNLGRGTSAADRRALLKNLESQQRQLGLEDLKEQLRKAEAVRDEMERVDP